MPDGTGLDYAEERSAIRRALRVRRIHTPSQVGAPPKHWRRARWVCALVAVGAAGVAIALVSQAPRQAAPATNRVAGDAPSPAPARLAAAPPVTAAEPLPVALPPSEPIALGQPAPEELRVALEASPAGAEPSPTDTTQGLRIVNAIAGNRFGLRAGDVVVDLCDRAGVETAVDISAAIATDATTCLTLARAGSTTDVNIAPAAEPPPAPHPVEPAPADNTPATLER